MLCIPGSEQKVRWYAADWWIEEECWEGLHNKLRDKKLGSRNDSIKKTEKRNDEKTEKKKKNAGKI